MGGCGCSVGPMSAITEVRVGGWVSSFIALYVIALRQVLFLNQKLTSSANRQASKLSGFTCLWGYRHVQLFMWMLRI